MAVQLGNLYAFHIPVGRVSAAGDIVVNCQTDSSVERPSTFREYIFQPLSPKAVTVASYDGICRIVITPRRESYNPRWI